VADRSRLDNPIEAPLHRPAPSAPDVGREPWPEDTEAASPPDRARSYFQEHPHARWLFIMLAILAVAVGAYVWHYYSMRESTDDAEIDGHIVPVSPRVGGTVIGIDVSDNQYVEKGAILGQLDPKDYQVALEHARADLANAQAAAAAVGTGIPIVSTTTTSTLSSSHAALNAARKEVEAAQAHTREAEANYTKVAADLKRAALLVAKEEISQQQYDAAVAAEQSAKASVEAAQAMVASAQSHVAQAEAGVRAAQTGPHQVAVTRARAAEAQAAVLRARAVVDQAELNLQYTTVRAPFAGVVSKRSAEPGQVISAGQPIFSLIDLENIYITANFKETQLGHMCPGQPAIIHVDTFRHDYRGYVDSFSGATGERFSLLPPENATGNFVKVVQRLPVKLVLEKGEDPKHDLRPGMSVEPTVMTERPCSNPSGTAAPRSPDAGLPGTGTPSAMPAGGTGR
jgi:membrane fusion protein (multidrug efflux system)